MTTALAINDLAINKELDRKAMGQVFGRGRVGYNYTGSYEGGLSAYQYTGNYFMNFVGNVYNSTHGWVKKYKTGYEYKREQKKWNYFEEFWT